MWVSCNKDSNELPPIETESIKVSKAAYLSGTPIVEAILEQEIATDGTRSTQLSWKNVLGTDIVGLRVYYKLCSDDGTCYVTDQFRASSISKDSTTAAMPLYFPQDVNVTDLDPYLEVLTYNGQTHTLAGLYTGTAYFEVASGDSFFVNANGLINASGVCNFDLTYGAEQRTISGQFVDTSDFFGSMIVSETEEKPLQLGAYTDTSGTVLDVIVQETPIQLGFRLDVKWVDTDSLTAISFDLLKQ